MQVKEQAGNTLVIIYQHVGERLKADLVKKDIHPSKYVTLLCSFLRRYECKPKPTSSSSGVKTAHSRVTKICVCMVLCIFTWANLCVLGLNFLAFLSVQCNAWHGTDPGSDP